MFLLEGVGQSMTALTLAVSIWMLVGALMNLRNNTDLSGNIFLLWCKAFVSPKGSTIHIGWWSIECSLPFIPPPNVHLMICIPESKLNQSINQALIEEPMFTNHNLSQRALTIFKGHLVQVAVVYARLKKNHMKAGTFHTVKAWNMNRM